MPGQRISQVSTGRTGTRVAWIALLSMVAGVAPPGMRVVQADDAGVMHRSDSSDGVPFEGDLRIPPARPPSLLGNAMLDVSLQGDGPQDVQAQEIEAQEIEALGETNAHAETRIDHPERAEREPDGSPPPASTGAETSDSTTEVASKKDAMRSGKEGNAPANAAMANKAAATDKTAATSNQQRPAARWFRKNWPYLLAGTLLVGLGAYIAVQRSQGGRSSDPPEIVIRPASDNAFTGASAAVAR